MLYLVGTRAIKEYTLLTNSECDRAFTRSDALAKHMRTVHETEALRPSDPIPKSTQPPNKPLRMKFYMKDTPPAEKNNPGAANGITNGNGPSGWTSSYPAELGFTADEEARGPKELWRLLRRQLHWAKEEGDSLKRECDVLEEILKNEWLEKELFFDQYSQSEIDWAERRREVLAGLANLPPSDVIKAAAGRSHAFSPPMVASSPPAASVQPVEDQREAAAVLASLHQA